MTLPVIIEQTLLGQLTLQSLELHSQLAGAVQHDVPDDDLVTTLGFVNRNLAENQHLGAVFR